MKVCPKCNEKHNKRGSYCNKTIIKKCLNCENKLETSCNPKEKKMCSARCGSIYASKKAAQKKIIEDSTCKMCGKKFSFRKLPKDGVIGCSPRCRFQLRNGPEKCAYCKKEFMPKFKGAKVCSLKCSGKIAQREESREKRKKTNLEKYGAENPFASKEIKEKIKADNFERHGVEYTAQLESTKKKIEETNMKKFGTKTPLQNKDILKKMQETNMERYNHHCSLYNPEVRKKTFATNDERYGANTPFESPIIQAKIKESFTNIYGVDNPFKSKEIQEKIKEIMNEKYDSDNYSNSKAAEEEYLRRVEKILSLFEQGKSEHEIAEEMNCEYITVRRVLLKHNLVKANNISEINKKWKHLIKSALGIDFEFEGSIFTNKRLKVDLFNSDLKIAIDINPTVTHSTQLTPYTAKLSKKTTPINYHRDRGMNAENNGWELIQIFDWDNEEDILELLRARFYNKKIYARKCLVREISIKESKEFLNENHRQKAKSNSSIQYGLFYREELVQVMTFSKERFSREKKEDSYELLRLASKKRITVVGGASKLLKAFINSEYKPLEIKSFVDFAKGSGKSYVKMGMEFSGFANMNALYSSIHGKEAYKVTEVTNKFKDEYQKLGMSQQEYMNSKGFYRITDAGNKVFTWKREI